MDITKETAKLKFKLFNQGVKLDDSILLRLKSEGYRIPAKIRTGASFGLETIINQELYVNIPTSNTSPISLSEDLRYLICNSRKICSVMILKNSVNLSLNTEDGKVIDNVVSSCFDRLGMTIFSRCMFKKQGVGCRFCGIDNASHSSVEHLMSVAEALEMLKKSLEIPNNGIRHILLSGGVLPGETFGIERFSEIAYAIKQSHPHLSIYAMLPAPHNPQQLSPLIEAGIDEIGLNIEVVDPVLRKSLIPGKEEIGIDTYFDALSYLSERMPKYGVRSILMGGIEPTGSTLKGIEMLCERGVMPIISHYRQPKGVSIQSYLKDENDMFDLWEKAADIADKYNMVIGPICIPCQNNVIALPIGEQFKFY